MSALMVNEWLDFNTLKDMLQVTDGNLSSHIQALEKEKFVEMKKEFVGRRPKTSFRVTKDGKKAFSLHLNALEQILKGLS
ncbi:MAG: transcriptional regulator [Bacteroidetes bacterium]|nr:transcriptional regulator [Bacteroidota bacterium]